MILKLADLVIEVKSRYRYTFDFCRDYIYDGDEKPVFTVFATNEQLEEEKKKDPGFPYEVLENTCIYRNLCNEILNYDAVFIHSAAISVDERAYLFSANSGTGKTTHMNLWLEKFGKRAFVINGDKPILRKSDNGFKVYGTPWCGKEGLNKNVGIPLAGICILEQAKNNVIRKADNKDALLFLLTQTTRPKDAKLVELMYENLGKLIESVDVYRLKCNMEMEACEICYRKMSQGK